MAQNPPSSLNRQGSSQAWEAITRFLPRLEGDSHYWWNATGPLLATVMDAADYPAEKQYEALLFHYNWIIPQMGPGPVDGKLAWPSMFSALNGLPMTFSWKWNTEGSTPEVRYTFEPTSHQSGTAADPLNQEPSRQILRQAQSVIPTLDVELVEHLMDTIYDEDRSKYVREGPPRPGPPATSVLLSAEWAAKGLAMKSWILPRELVSDNSELPTSNLEKSIARYDPDNAARSAVYDFATNTAEGRTLKPIMLGVDNVAPMKSRLKMYFRAPRTSFASVREVMTLGGKIKIPEAQINELRGLIASIGGFGLDFDDQAQMRSLVGGDSDSSRQVPAAVAGYMYYFDVAPGSTIPNIKLYIQLPSLMMNDSRVAHGIAEWMVKNGRGQYSQQYLQLLRGMALDKQLEAETRLQGYLSCMFLKDGELEITSYLAPRPASSV